MSQQETGRWWLDDVLVIAIFGSVLTFVVLAVNGVPGARYLVAAVVFASVLAGRIVAQAWQRLRPGRMTRAICVVGVAVSLCFAAGLGCTLAQPVAAQSASTLASFLEAHHLRNGVGGYWAASITTVESKGAVTVRPVWANQEGKLGRYMKLSSAGWYAGQQFQFLVYETPVYQGVDSTSATKTWGPPAHIYVVGGYHVLVWSDTFSVAPFPPPQDQAQLAARSVRHMIVSHAQTRRHSRLGIVDPLVVGKPWSLYRHFGLQSVHPHPPAPSVPSRSRPVSSSSGTIDPQFALGAKALPMPVPVANSYHWGHSMRGLILRPGGTTPIHLRGRPHAVLRLHTGARLVVRTLAAGRVGRRRGHESQTMALVVIGGVTCVGQQ